jgi:hypothetical protein
MYSPQQILTAQPPMYPMYVPQMYNMPYPMGMPMGYGFPWQMPQVFVPPPVRMTRSHFLTPIDQSWMLPREEYGHLP